MVKGAFSALSQLEPKRRGLFTRFASDISVHTTKMLMYIQISPTIGKNKLMRIGWGAPMIIRAEALRLKNSRVCVFLKRRNCVAKKMLTITRIDSCFEIAPHPVLRKKAFSLFVI